MKKISIVTPSFNQGEYLEQTIDSVLSQEYSDLEYIIIDGGSTDNSVEIIKKYSKYIKYWVSEKDAGQSDAINKGLKKASGEIINWINSDDWYTSGTLLKVGEAFEDDSVNVFGGRSNIIENGHVLYQNKGTDIYDSIEKTIGFARIDQPETFFRKTCIDQIGLLNINFHYVMDRDWWIRYLLQFGLNNIKKTSDILVNFRSHDTSKTNTSLEKFDKEANDLYYTLACQYALPESVEFEKIWNTKIVPNAIYSTNLSIVSVQKIIHHYFFQLFLIAYAKSNYKEATVLKKCIQSDLLSVNDALHLKDVTNRIKYIPVWLKKLLNKR